MSSNYWSKEDIWTMLKFILYVLFLLVALGTGIWYQWLDISTKLAIRDAVRQQQEAKP